ncbi:hypothetical protein L1987_03970 [Smallanthus sonchifolius]|uniref:Uncharacterized protein n=1 Tax=Smallanthus sonchifolius TaxID=185202 RepID=A0ACB9KC57_9ASTR|nr:hypothetical protein L1987_03970 [Smallanthus sonchifolius]
MTKFESHMNDRMKNVPKEHKGINGVGRWLEDVGFGRNAYKLQMHKVDKEALPLLTMKHLKEIGILAINTRRKRYAAIC